MKKFLLTLIVGAAFSFGANSSLEAGNCTGRTVPIVTSDYGCVQNPKVPTANQYGLVCQVGGFVCPPGQWLCFWGGGGGIDYCL